MPAKPLLLALTPIRFSLSLACGPNSSLTQNMKNSWFQCNTTLEEESVSRVPETALLSEAALAEDWDRPEEAAAWSHLQPAQSF